jgi:hypothetical protein
MFLRDVDPLRGTAVFTPMTEQSYRASSFLDNRIVRAGEKDVVADLDDLIDLASRLSGQRRVIHYLFHVGHCGSTLVSRILGERPCYLSLREPPLLMGLSRSARALGHPGFPISRDRWESLRDLSLMTLAKTWRPGQRSLVKPTSHAGNLIPMLMRHTGQERAIMLYTDLETHLVSMLRQHTRRETRLYGRDFRVREFSSLVPGSPETADAYEDGPLAAMSWLLQAREMVAALDDPNIGPRCMLLHFDSFLADPIHVTERICRFLGPALAVEEKPLMDSAPWLSVAAKMPGQPFSVEDRRRELAASRADNTADLTAGVRWAAALAESGPFTGLTDRFPHARAQPTPP